MLSLCVALIAAFFSGAFLWSGIAVNIVKIVAVSTGIIVFWIVWLGLMIYEKLDSLKTAPPTPKETLEG